ncbi:hypothetical protein C8Q79DRAFT_996867 [Trametes meyenii]|nr:hypothetical protein C8Q79DRAFT_996867 [Trametes meyenii]
MLSKIPSVLSISGMLCFACYATLTSAEGTNVTWISPSDGDTYASGDTLVGRWSTDKPVVSPSFRMCVTDHASQVSSRSDSGDDEDDGEDSDSRNGGGDDDDNNGGGSCGATMWPTVEHSGGSYLVHMSLPNVTSSAHCYLLMVDNFGAKMSSPTFSFGDTPTADEASPTNDPPTPSASTSASTSDPSATSTPPSAVNAIGTQNPATPQPPAVLDESHMPVPTAAYAVPLSLVASVILAAGGLSVHQRRKLRSERLREQETLRRRGALSRHSTLSLGGFLKLGARTGSSSASEKEKEREEGEGEGAFWRRKGARVARATSVSMMRAWRRDVERHERRGDADSFRGCGYGPEDGFTSIPLRSEPRRPTREPYHASHSRARRTTVPASLFRAVEPAFPSAEGDGWGGADSGAAHGGGGGGGDRRRTCAYSPSEAYRSKEGERHDDGEELEDWGVLKRKGRTLVDPGVVDPSPRRRGGGGGGRDAYLNASVNDSVVERYLQTSPVPPPPSPPSVSVSVSRPDRLLVRRYAEADREEKRLPPPPREADRELYA